MTDTQKEALWKLRRFNLVQGRACIVNEEAPGHLHSRVAYDLVQQGWAERGDEGKLFITNRGLDAVKQEERGTR